jgi:hypothetical protein
MPNVFVTGLDVFDVSMVAMCCLPCLELLSEANLLLSWLSMMIQFVHAQRDDSPSTARPAAVILTNAP